MLLCYVKYHVGDVYCMYNLLPRRVVLIRDVQLINVTCKDYLKGKKIP